MNEELQANLAEVLGAITDGVTQTKDFAVEQLPDVAHQYIMFSLAFETVSFVLAVAILITSVVVGLRAVKRIKAAPKYETADSDVAITIVCGFGTFLSGLIALALLKPLLMVWFAPKVYLLQGIATLIK
jgi:hypothetical protein